jgi:hypothetical protein
MNQLLGSIADRLVTLAVPKTTAGACCPPDPYRDTCYCGPVGTDGHPWIYYRDCRTNCGCQESCGGCYTLGTWC